MSSTASSAESGNAANGAARTKLTNAYFDRVLGTIGTGRNWRTAQKLLELCGK